MAEITELEKKSFVIKQKRLMNYPRLEETNRDMATKCLESWTKVRTVGHLTKFGTTPSFGLKAT